MSAQDLEFTHKLADAADKISMARFGAIDLKIETKPDLTPVSDADKSVEEVFTQYEKLRMNKAHFVVNTSWKIGKIAQLENSIAIWLRNVLVKMMPKSSNEKQLDKIFNIEYKQ